VTRKPANIQAFQYHFNCWIQTNKTKIGGEREREKKEENNKIERRKKNRGGEVNERKIMSKRKL